MGDFSQTRQNVQLQSLTSDLAADAEQNKNEIIFKSEIEPRVAELIRLSITDSTRIGYRSDLDHFMRWGGVIPATAEMVAAYLAEFSETLAVATNQRRVAAISVVHDAGGYPNPCKSILVRSTMNGIKRLRGVAQKQAKPLLKEDLVAILDVMGDGVKDARDRALLLLGFAGAFRRSELIGLDHADIEHVRQGVILHLRKSKTDQLGHGRKIGVPPARGRHCPVAAIDAWLERSGIVEGAVFRNVNRHGQIASTRLSGEGVALVVRERLKAAGLDPAGFSGHSLRAGFCTSAAQVGVSSLKIKAQTGHSSDAMLSRYIRDGQLFLDNACAALL
jgi:integrase